MKVIGKATWQSKLYIINYTVATRSITSPRMKPNSFRKFSRANRSFFYLTIRLFKCPERLGGSARDLAIT